MNYGYSTFTGRPPRRGLPYGMTQQKAARLAAIGQDEAVIFKQHCENLFTFAGIYVQHARDLAKSGQKDAARNWFRFFNNAQIVNLCRELKVSGDVEKLREDLNYLGLECHPLDAASFETDLQAIRACLTEILSHVKKSPRKTKTVGRFNHRRTNPRVHRHG